MATMTQTMTATPPPGGIYPDGLDATNFNYLQEHATTLELYNQHNIQERILHCAIKKLFVEGGLYTEGVPQFLFNIIHNAMDELALHEHTPNTVLSIGHYEGMRVYLQPRNFISSGERHIGNVWIFMENRCPELYMVKLN